MIAMYAHTVLLYPHAALSMSSTQLGSCIDLLEMDFLYNKFGLKYAGCENTTPEDVLIDREREREREREEREYQRMDGRKGEGRK